jgi:hypothetical protein
MSRNKKSLYKHKSIIGKPVLGGLILSCVWVRMVDKHTLKSYCSVWSSDLFLLFIVFITEKSASHRYDARKGRSALISFFVVMGYSCWKDIQKQAISVDERFSFSLLSFLISISSSSATVNSALSNVLNTNGSLTQSKKGTSGKWNKFQCFSSEVANFAELNRQDFFFQSLTFCRLKHFTFVLFFFYFGSTPC